MDKRSVQFLCLVLFANFLTTSGYGDEYFTLKNPHSGLVIDVDTTKNFATLQGHTGADTQLWRMEPARRGAYYIINKATEKYLDIDYSYPVSNSWVMVSKKIMNECSDYDGTKAAPFNSDACQQWFINADNTIVSGCASYAVEIRNDKYTPGVILETFGISGKANQKFEIHYA